MVNLNCGAKATDHSNVTLNGGGTLKIDTASNQYILKIKSGLIKGKFQGTFRQMSVEDAELLSLKSVNDTRDRYTLTDADFAFANVKGTNFLEGLLYFTKKEGRSFALFVKGVFKRKPSETLGIQDSTRRSDQPLFGCFSFEATDMSNAGLLHGDH